jgi:outer membrane protein, multidrug efflux system
MRHAQSQNVLWIRCAVTYGLICLVAVVSACVGPRPAIPAAAAIAAPPTAWRTWAGPTGSIGSDWWRGFGDSQLTVFVERALRRNADIGTAVARVEEARALSRLARAQQMPLATFLLNTGPSRILVLAHGVDGYAAAPQVAISYDLDLFGRLSQATSSARAALLASATAGDSVALATASATASSYLTLLGLDARLATTRATLAARGEALRVARRRAQAGYTSQLELRQAESEYQATEQLEPAAELAVSRQENALSILVGDPPGDIKRGVAFNSLVTPAIPEGLPSELLRRRPDLVSAQATLIATDRTLDSARAAELPDFSLTTTGGAALSTALPNPIALYSVAANVLAPLVDGGRLRAQADTTAARRDQAAFAYRRAVLSAYREVEDSLASVQKLREQQVSVDNEVATLSETLRLATNRYNDGYAPYLDQLDAQRGLLGAQLVAIQIASDRLNAIVTLYQALGGGWQLPDRDQPFYKATAWEQP